MTLTAFLLVVLIGGPGYITVPDLVSKEECDKLGRVIQNNHTHILFGDVTQAPPIWRCYPYEKAPAR